MHRFRTPWTDRQRLRGQLVRLLRVLHKWYRESFYSPWQTLPKPGRWTVGVVSASSPPITSFGNLNVAARTRNPSFDVDDVSCSLLGKIDKRRGFWVIVCLTDPLRDIIPPRPPDFLPFLTLTFNNLTACKSHQLPPSKSRHTRRVRDAQQPASMSSDTA
jgi:hypothetical protein